MPKKLKWFFNQSNKPYFLWCLLIFLFIFSLSFSSKVFTPKNAWGYGNYGWVERTSSGARYWEGIASSADGTKLAAVAYSGYIYTSTDGGATWTERTSAGLRNWQSIASSVDGTKLAAVVVGSNMAGYIYTSTDSGATWTERTSAGSRYWASITSSSDGTKLAATSDNGSVRYIYTSADSGATWTTRTSAGTRDWKSIASSSDGTKLVAVDKKFSGGGYIYTSTDSGATWTERTSAGPHHWYSVASSYDGTKMAAVDSYGYIYTSADSGATWTERTSAGINYWSSITSSSDGTKLAVAAGNSDGDNGNGMAGYIYTSTDSGATWVEETSAGTHWWSSITSSSDGTKLAANASSVYIHTNSGSFCGNGQIDSGEECDGTNLNNKSCVSLGFAGGTLQCESDCRHFDTSSCSVGNCSKVNPFGTSDIYLFINSQYRKFANDSLFLSYGYLFTDVLTSSVAVTPIGSNITTLEDGVRATCPGHANTCTDTDGGINYNQYGTATAKDSGGNILDTKSDTCSGSSVTEYYCQNNQIANTSSNCANGCENGACKSAASTCTDTDGGINYNQYGTATAKDSGGNILDTKSDTCSGSSVTEYYCQNNQILNTSSNCANGCENGACKQQNTNSGDCPVTVQYDGGPWNAAGTVRNQGGYYRVAKVCDSANNCKCWFKDNLNIGTQITAPTNSIPWADRNNINQTNNGLVEKFCYQASSPTNNYPAPDCNLTGGLYQAGELYKYDFNNQQGLCPAGWRIPTQSDWSNVNTTAIDLNKAGAFYKAGVQNGSLINIFNGYAGAIVNGVNHNDANGYFYGCFYYHPFNLSVANGADSLYCYENGGFVDGSSVIYFGMAVSARCIKDATQSSTAICTDTDGGQIWDVSGYTSNTQGYYYQDKCLLRVTSGNNTVYTPVNECSGDQCVLQEGYCTGPDVNNIAHSCANGCANGACKPSATATCGDGIKNGTEQCDKTDLGGATCTSLGYTGGTLACSSNCNWTFANCEKNNISADCSSPLMNYNYLSGFDPADTLNSLLANNDDVKLNKLIDQTITKFGNHEFALPNLYQKLIGQQGCTWMEHYDTGALPDSAEGGCYIYSYVEGKKVSVASDESCNNVASGKTKMLKALKDGKCCGERRSGEDSNENKLTPAKMVTGENNELILRLNRLISALEQRVIDLETRLTTAINKILTNRLRGYLIIQPEANGEVWYTSSDTGERFYVADGQAAYGILSGMGKGITGNNLKKVPIGYDPNLYGDLPDTDDDGLPDVLEEAIGTDPAVADTDGDTFDDLTEVMGGYNPNGAGQVAIDKTFTKKLKGIYLDVDNRGAAWYINPKDFKRYYVSPETAYNVMKYLSLGVANKDLRQIPVGEVSE